MMVVIRRAFSNAVRFLMSKPFCAAMDVEIATTSGTARPSACGQAITNTVTTRFNTSILKDSAIVQAMAVMSAAARAM